MKSEKMQEIFKSCSDKKCRLCDEEIKEYDPENISFGIRFGKYVFYHDDCIRYYDSIYNGD